MKCHKPCSPVRKLLSASAEKDAAQGVSGHRDREAAVSDEIPFKPITNT